MYSSKSSIELYLENRMNEYTNIINKIELAIPECANRDNSKFIEKVRSISLHDREKMKMFVGNCYERYSDKLTELYNLLDEMDSSITNLETCVNRAESDFERTPVSPSSPMAPVKSISPIAPIAPIEPVKPTSQKISPKPTTQNKTRKATTRTTTTRTTTVAPEPGLNLFCKES